MNKEFFSLIELLKLSICSKCCINKKIFENVSWNLIYQSAMEQGVAGVCISGIEQLPKDLRPTSEILLQWIGVASKIETTNRQRSILANNIADLWKRHNLRTIVMKGMSIGMLYPVPLRRYSCDLDTFLIREGQTDYMSELWSAWADGDKTVEDCHIIVNRDYYRNSSFNFNGLHIENHRYCTYVKGNKRAKRFELLLRSLLNEPTTIIEGNLEAPCAMFVALHTLSHAQGHFLAEGITLRHVCDWAIILDSYRDKLDWCQFLTYCKEYGIDKFLYSLTRLVQKFFNISVHFDCGENNASDQKLLEDIYNLSNHLIKGTSPMARRIGYAKQKLHSSWKYRYFSDKSMILALFQQTCGYLFEKDPKLT